jgi:hypothetical protein
LFVPGRRFRFDVTGALREGKNELEIDVTPLGSTWKFWKAGDTLHPAGLIGPVRLETEAVRRPVTKTAPASAARGK